ncbi:NADH-quinone oxidoreductase subunit G [Halarcobacter bivalviorum]|uniref:NADH-quinone oxidoreductase subunit G n=1 Tax=Halarcobacter bivalviorum TaxID=663364 RepID=UPI00100B8B8A|nr:NADH-quinone oxidoreductase subunit G [Halarcobacter bivalviorum]RXK04995.1 ferredoxin [Halarcobacter bivalviorum]
MSDLISLTINGKVVEAKSDETILNTARANDIFIPALCYLTRCSPTLACRLCLVEADGKQIYACNAKVKEGMNVVTSTANIEKERRAIMEVYDVNHPLQCGVCDQSGECELQNYTLYMKLDSQSYSIKDVPRPTQHWGVMNYDPGLCIVCEKCVTVCKDMIGSNALSTVKRGSEPIDKYYKDEMPKDAYSMWNKLNKSLIGFEEDNCTDCGECISVCPVGALVSNDFQYKSNAWELTRIPAANPHSSDCAYMYYETKHTSIEDSSPKIYRVTNEHHYSTLNGAARFAYDFENKAQGKDEKAFNEAIEAFKKAESIKFNSYITNEEALLLQKIAQQTGAKLVNKDAFRFKRFLENYSLTSGSSLYSSTLKDVHDSNFVISIGAYLKSDLPSARYALNNSVIMNKGAALYFHPVQDPVIEKIGKRGKTTEFIYHKPNVESSILYLILYLFAKDLPLEVQEFIDSKKEQRVKTVVETKKEQVVELIKDEETGEEKEVKKLVTTKEEKQVEFEYIKFLDDIQKDETLLELIELLREKKDKFSLIIGEDLIHNENYETLGKLCGLIDKYTAFDVVILPPQTNSLGVSLICDNLYEKESGFTLGYNEKADFELSALGEADLDIPALNQQEGTFTNIDKKVIPTNAALDYKAYVLNDLANRLLEVDVDYTIEYTKELPEDKGFSAIDFDRLPNYFGNNRSEYRGYDLREFETKMELELKKDESLALEAAENEIIIYKANPINQFNEFTAIAHEFKENFQSGIFFSKSLFEKLQLEENQELIVEVGTVQRKLKAYCEKQIEGEIALVSTFEKELDTKVFFENSRYAKASVKKA